MAGAWVADGAPHPRYASWADYLIDRAAAGTRSGTVPGARPGAALGDGETAPAPSLNVLIVEDDAFIALDIEGTVEDTGHVPVGIATTADSAVAMAERLRPDIVLMDLRLADGSFGGDAARTILDRFGIRSIFVSGNLDPATRALLADLEPVAMISKPFLPIDLERALDAASERAN